MIWVLVVGPKRKPDTANHSVMRVTLGNKSDH